METTNCATCGKEITRSAWHFKTKQKQYCSKKCHYNRYDWGIVEKKYGGKVKRVGGQANLVLVSLVSIPFESS